MRPFRHVVDFIRMREGRDTHRVRRLANIKQPDQLLAVFLVIEHRFVQHHQQIAVRQRQRGVRPTAKRRAPVTVANELRLGAILHVQQRQAAVAPAAVRGIPRNNRVVEGVAFPFRPVRLFACGLVHPRQPPAPRHLGLARVRQVNGQENVVGKTVDQRRHVRPAATDVPDAVNADAAQRQKADFARPVRRGDIKNAKPGAPAPVLNVADGLSYLTGVVDLLVGEAGIGKQIPGVDHQQQVVMRLEVHVPGARRRGDIARGFRIFWIAHVDNRKALRHHMADIRKAAVHHQLHAIRTTALVAMANQPHIAAVFWRRKHAHLFFASSVANHGAIKSSVWPQPGMILPSDATFTAPGCAVSSACGIAAALKS